MVCYYVTTGRDSSGMYIQILLKGEWDGKVFTHINKKGLSTKVYKKEWLVFLTPITKVKEELSVTKRIWQLLKELYSY